MCTVLCMLKPAVHDVHAVLAWGVALHTRCMLPVLSPVGCVLAARSTAPISLPASPSLTHAPAATRPAPAPWLNPSPCPLPPACLQVGSLVSGTVRRIEHFGVFVGINNTRVSGLLHISNVSRQHVDTVQVRGWVGGWVGGWMGSGQANRRAWGLLLPHICALLGAPLPTGACV